MSSGQLFGGALLGVFLVVLAVCYLTFGYAAVDTLAPVAVYGFWPQFCGKTLLWMAIGAAVVRAFRD